MSLAAPTLAIPPSALHQHIAILGKTGAGKTFAAKGIVEHLLDSGERVCIIDPTGAWHGLRSSASGKSAGYPVVIFGGAHADLTVGAAHGEAIAEIIGTSSTPAIIDTSLLRVGERSQLFADFADALVRKNKGPLHLVIDEAHLFAPQGKVADPRSGQMLHAANNLVSLGRSRGLRIILITQRPAKLHKDSLSQVETLVAMRLIAPQDRSAVEDWIKDNADREKGREVLSSLAALRTGQAWVWAPEIGIDLDLVAFPKIKTFDSSRAPAGGEGGKSGPVLAPIDRDAIAKRLESVAADALANDPKVLRAEIAKLKKELQARVAPPAAADALDVAEQRGMERGKQLALQAIDKFSSDLVSSVDRAVAACGDAQRLLNSYATFMEQLRRSTARALPQPSPKPAQSLTPATAKTGNGALPPGERAVLAAALQYRGVDRDQLSVLTGYKRSTRDAYIQRLRERGYIEVDGPTVAPTPAGTAALPDYAPLPSGADLQEYWLQRLPPGERAILDALIAAYPNAVPRGDLDSSTGYKRSTRDAYIQRLNARRLVAIDGTSVRASETLF